MATKQVELQLAHEGKGCLGKAAMDEPLFILRAQDTLAPRIVEEWANRACANTEAAAKVREARALAHQMRAWQELNFKKMPD